MKKGALHFLGRKSQSLFDTNIKIKDMDNVELVLDSPAIPESGTASVRARPTVKHHASSDSFQGFAVPTPKVPLLPPVSGPKVNGSVGKNQLSNGSVISVPDLVEGEIFIPPPPSTAPPPPPGTFIPPPPDFMGDLNSRSLHLFHSYQLPDKIPEHPKFAPPQPPIEKQQKTPKAPPPKPIRLSSIPTLDSPPQTPAPPPPVQAPALSSFNPQNTAKLYSIPKASVLSGYEDRDTRPKQMLLLEDSGSVKTSPVLVQVDGKAPKEATPIKSVHKEAQDVKENLQISQPSQPPPPEPKKEAQTVPVSAEPDIAKPPQPPPQTSIQPQKVNSTQSRKFSPLIDRKLRSLKSGETSGAREGHAASPLALLMAAKERDKHKSAHNLSRENTAKTNEQQSASIHPSDSSPNSFVVIPKGSSSLASRVEESPKLGPAVELTPPFQIPTISNSTPLVTNQMPSTSQIKAAASPGVTSLGEQTQKAEQSPSKSQLAQPENKKSGLIMPVLPPPPEFDDLDELMEPPPSILPPDPPSKKGPKQTVNIPPPASVLAPTVSLPPPAPVLAPAVNSPPPAPVPPPSVNPPPPALVPSPPPKPNSPAAPKFPPPDISVKPKSQVQTKTQVAPTQIPSNLSPSQATLLSILQKKMRRNLVSDDWGTPLSDEDNKVTVVSKATPQSKNIPVYKKAATLDMRELESKVVKKNQETSSMKVPTSNGPSKYPYGLTFTVRPGTKQPITLVSKGESS
ncbi:hypothetical protein Q5P01_001685 [Channa striata]|uniref:Uncharacterized protein n=1 Tax=Channa striata TaxID=64152 RepID=A0AA88NNI3_CHASR|nr:hypothetical protein Q5P01_001685 [Channa striata]